MEDIQQIFSSENMLCSWEKVKLKGSSGGIDNVSITDFENPLQRNLETLKDEVLSGSYVPEPYRLVFMSKAQKNEFRRISLPAVKDKILQHCILSFYSPLSEKLFINTSYAYRPNKGHAKAIRRIKDYLARKYMFVYPADIDNFFDEINRELLFEKCGKLFVAPGVLSLIKMWVKTGMVYNEKYISTGKGIAQGGVISPLLSNLYLHDFDRMLDENKIPNVRYADNFILLAKTEQEINNYATLSRGYLTNELCLRLNKNEKELYPVEKGFTFCGIYFGNYKCVIDEKKFSAIKEKLRAIILRTPLEKLAGELNPHIDGIKRYYLAFDTAEQFAALRKEMLILTAEKCREELNNRTVCKKDLASFISRIELPEMYPNKNRWVKDVISAIHYGHKDLKTEKEINGNDDVFIERKLTLKKRSVQKIWYKNLDIIISQSNTQIGQSGEKITLRREGKIINEISPSKIKNILISAKGVTISSNAVKLAVGQNIRIDYFDEIGNPYAGIVHTAGPLYSLTILQAEASDNYKAAHLIKQLITSKIKNQQSLIRYFIKNKILEDEKKKIFDCSLEEMECLADSIQQISADTELEALREKVLGYEGSAAVSYWRLVRMLIADEYEFTEREHRSAKNIVNMMLNYSYGILYTRVLSAVTLAGLNPSIAFLHREQKNKPVLIFDVIEQFRAPVAERTVIALLSKSSKIFKEKELLSMQTKNLLSEKTLLRLNTIIKYRSKELSLNEIILEQAREIAAYLKDEIKSYKPFLNKW